MANEKVAAKVAEHDAANRKAADETAEEAELQARIAATSKPLEPTSSAVPGSGVIIKPPARPAQMPDGSPVPELTREKKLILALENLVNCLDEMASDETFKRVWQVAKENGAVYEGRVWKPELDFAKLVLEQK